MYISNKAEPFSSKGGHGAHEYTRMKVLKEELAWATDKQLRTGSNIMLFKTVSYMTKELKACSQ